MNFTTSLNHLRSLRHFCHALGRRIVFKAAGTNVPAPRRTPFQLRQRITFMSSFHTARLLPKLKPRFLMLPILAVLAFAGVAVTLPENSVANRAPAPPAVGPSTTNLNPPQAQCPTSTNRSVVGEFGPVTSLPLVPVHLSVLPDDLNAYPQGRILFWGRDMTTDASGNVKQVTGRSEAYVWNVANGSMVRVDNLTTNLFCSGHSFLPDGRLLVAGGHKSADFDAAGETHVNIFDYRQNSWSRAPDMNQGRWYPYNVTLNTGEALIMSGTYWTNAPSTPPSFAINLIPQVYTTAGTLRNLNQPGSLTYYPFVHLTPDGKVLQTQSGFTNFLNPINVDQDSRLLDPDANQGSGAWTSLGGTMFPHAMGSSVLFDSGRKALVVGGFDSMFNPTKGAEFINLKPAQGQPTWTALASMNFARTYHTATILPNGKVLVTGGVSCKGGNNIENPSANCFGGQVLVPEMWDPTANPSNPAQTPWCQMAAHTEIRAYHSVAALLPDGRVLVGGGGLPGAVGETVPGGQKIVTGRESFARLFGHKNMEIYSPPYLFTSSGASVDTVPGARPAITSAPGSVAYGQSFSVGTTNAGANPTVSLVRLASVTHGFNQDQRQINLPATVNGSSGLTVTGPADSNKCPPGHYMLFVLNSNGVPSVSRIVKVVNTPAYEGYVDGSDCTQIWGWAWDRSKPNTPINVDIYSGSTYITTVPANVFRQDLLTADKGNGKHAFVLAVPASLKNGQTQSITVRFAGTGTSLGLSPRSIVCNASLFPTDVPQTTAGGAGSTWEQGIEFSSSVSGKITHIRFWKAPGEPTGNHVGRIWTATGVPLASAPFTNESASGWQVAQLQPALQISAGVRYKVTYNIHSVVAKTFNTLSSPITRGALTGWGSIFSTPAGSFPTTGSTSNLFADVIFNSPQ
jgi:hypothetical protein